MRNPWNYTKHKKRDGYQMNIFKNKTLAYSTETLNKKNGKKKKKRVHPSPHARSQAGKWINYMSKINNEIIIKWSTIVNEQKMTILFLIILNVNNVKQKNNRRLLIAFKLN